MRENPGLMKLPVTGGVLAFIAIVVFAGPGGLLVSVSQDEPAMQVVGGLLIALGVYLSSYFVIYYNVALAAACDMAFRGQPVDNKAGVAVARSRRGVIAQWAAISLLVSLVFNLIRDRGGLVGEIAGALGAAIWALVTFLIAPVLAFEDIGPIQALKRSTLMFKEKWGQQVTGNIAIGGVTALTAFASVAVAVLGVYVLTTGLVAAVIAGGGLVLLGVAGFFASIVVSGAVRGVFGVALYRYVADGSTAGPFTADELESSVRLKKGARRGGIV